MTGVNAGLEIETGGEDGVGLTGAVVREDSGQVGITGWRCRYEARQEQVWGGSDGVGSCYKPGVGGVVHLEYF